ncbi:hypothetical protein PWT90_01347 [Aphanocladium album]|nr:hypothetical protein PWT90_01347 [Aphanocladium album]
MACLACPTTLRKPSKASKTEGLSSFRPTSATPFIGILGTYRQHHEIHTLSEAKFGFTRVMMEEMCMMVSIIAGFDPDNLHPRLAARDDTTLAQVTKGSTVSIVIPEGPFCRELGRLCDQDCMLIFGTSANATGQGQRFRLEDVGDEVLAHADLLVDYGLQKWHTYGSGAVNFHAQNIRVLRKGVAWEVFMDRAKRLFPQLLGEARGSFE